MSYSITYSFTVAESQYLGFWPNKEGLNKV